MGRLENKVALITGGASGMGMVASQLFASEGAKVVLTDVSDDAGERVAEQIRADGGEATYVHADVVERVRGAKRWWTTAVETYGGLTILYNNAGVMLDDDGSVHSTDEADLGEDARDQRDGRRARVQVRDPRHDRVRRRLRHQRGLVRRVDGRRHLPDRLYGVEGSGPRDDSRDGRRVRPEGSALQRPVPRPDRHAAARGAALRPRPAPTPVRPHPDGQARDRPRSSPRPPCSSRATTPAT